MGAPLQIGRYVLHGEIASGGMATVHYGRLVGTSGFAKTVAIKRLHRALAHNASFRRMILEEARLAARVRHPNVVPPLDVLAEGGELLLVMEYVHGESLSRLLRAAQREGESVPLAVAAAILSNMLHGLHAAHEARDEAGQPLDIVHRDISPQNVIVGVDGIARVIDFGIAKAVTSEEATTAGTIKGKVPYLSPEQLEGEPATRRTDIYAASVVFWEILAGRRLFDGADDAAILCGILGAPVRPPSVYNPLVPGTLDDVVLQGLARDPRQRFASAREMALALEEAIHLATSTMVGEWTERLAKDALAERTLRLAEVEAAQPPPTSARGSLPDGILPADEDATLPAPPSRTSVPPSSLPAPPPRTSKPPRVPKPSVRLSAPPVRPPMASHLAMEPRTVIYEPPALPEPAFVEGVRAIAREAPAPPPPLVPPAAGTLRKPQEEIRNVDWLKPVAPPEAAPGSAFRRFLRYLAAFLALTVIVGYMFAPALMRAWIVTGSAARGILVTIEMVDVSRKEIRLSDVKVESAELPGGSARAGAVVIGLHWLVPESITLDDVEVTLDGSYGVIGERLDAYRKAHPQVFGQALGGIRRIEVTSGRVVWKNPVGEGTSALVENITLEIGKIGVRPLGDDYHLRAPLFTMRIADAPAGPWQLDLDRQGILARAIVRLDPSGSYPASVTRTAGDDGSVSLAFQVPPTSLRDLHLPSRILGPLANDRTRLEAHGEVSIVAMSAAPTTGGGDAGAPGDAGAQVRSAEAQRTVSGHIVLAAGSLPVFPNGPLVDLSLDLPLEGDAARPIPISAILAIAPADPTGGASTATASAPLTGTLDVTGRVARVTMSGKSNPIACVFVKGASKEVQAATTGVRAAIEAALDDYPGSKVSFKPVGTCTPRLR